MFKSPSDKVVHKYHGTKGSNVDLNVALAENGYDIAYIAAVDLTENEKIQIDAENERRLAEEAERKRQEEENQRKLEMVRAGYKKADQARHRQEARSVLNIGLTFDEFKRAYKAKAAEFGDANWNIDGAGVKIGAVQDIFSYEFTPRLIMQGAIDKGTGKVKEVWVLYQIQDAEEIPMFVTTYGLIMATLNPELDLQGRKALTAELKLDSQLPELQASQGSAIAIRSGIRYTTQFIRSDLLQFIAAARDL